MTIIGPFDQFALAGESSEEEFRAAFAFRSHTPEGHLVDKIELISQARRERDEMRWDKIELVSQARRERDGIRWDKIELVSQARRERDGIRWDKIELVSQARGERDEMRWDKIELVSQARAARREKRAGPRRGGSERREERVREGERE